MIRHTFFFLLAILLPFMARGQATYQLRYWFDGDDQSAQTVSSADGSWDLDVNISSLSDYLHALHIQTVNADGVCSGVSTRYFVKLPSVSADSHAEATSVRYWFDGNDAQAKEVGISDGAISIDAEIDALDDYLHSLHLQVCNSDGTWGGVSTRYLVKLPAPFPAETPAEMYLVYQTDDGDVQTRKAALNEGKLLFELPTDQLTTGEHSITCFLMGNRGERTETVADSFLVTGIEIAKYTDEQGIIYHLYAKGDTAIVAGHADSYLPVITIPEQVDTTSCRVVTLADSAFYGMDRLLAVELPAGIARVGKEVFTGTTALAAVGWKAEATVPADLLQENDNPNLLLYINNVEQAANLVFNGHFVENGHTGSITLTEGYNFYAPRPFTADAISYTHTYTMQSGMNESRGWETIALPFDVESIRHETMGELAPFANYTKSETECPFWLGELGANGWQAARGIEANKPYLICMPNNEMYSDSYNVAGRVTFSARNANVPKTEALTAQGSQMTFMPALQHVAAADSIFAINRNEAYESYPEGSVFVRNLRSVQPFEAYIVLPASEAKTRYIPIASGLSSDIIDVTIDRSLTNQGIYYTLQGVPVKVPIRGIYILNGRKVLVK